MQISGLSSKVAKLFEAENSRYLLKPLPGLKLLRCTQATPLETMLYEPVICIILQGRKETRLAERTFHFGAGESLIVSHELPVQSRITEASPARPYLALILSIDLALLRSLYEQIAELALPSHEEQSLAVHQTDKALIETFSRYLDLIDKPLEEKILSPLLFKEIHFRLLIAAHGGMLRHLLWHDSHASRISRAIEHVRKNFASPLPVSDLARHVGMSASSFYQHFKSITGTTPLQYQKALRLLEARRLLSEGRNSVSQIAFDVGYESPTQFSREYARKFGASPRHELRIHA
ncbi:AraC family transcriptional regulator [bacterium (Candidatus Blackallbacteria) CG17_big_fil_post_rev_8_21_14_2_50_48_46]|uniref:AraC family transcriptional regulator n=1 Tax=bacterium (Candidatus Blackallbacteria) CG17_big_fil_post_rev_8_21_14_2_50_48_46 TaxID=2014261 RepID=A0A2M7G4M7_9BACT|nr:MAG: AraC family transcriptional regulator [bacterium (Candidatus Blackallbacteria) CG18_big_fil_WC_8_21_14_2_50_49_26]PIW16875.1 MAG: AraC family transcriptional regulator [bacterium (Candidatus Blackallbacteria) CG17_big_fil_post_rev_8_21_14_2_50_48_46]PIW48072.1 MAG: AraC family transcriptional regulator [bacterium (Candidatus Blackallbacteria) CG13_big_fil_rev_8_21_14_2_50_49_14]